MAKIAIKADGPYLVENVEVVDSQGKPLTLEAGKPVALCRCGQSGNKPFCDGTHAKIGFKSDIKA